MGGHQLLEVQPFDFGELPADPVNEVVPGGAHGEPEGAGASRCQVLLEIREGGLRRVVGQRVHEADPVRFLRPDAAPREEEIRRAGRTDPLREQAGGRGSEHRQLDLGLSEHRAGSGEDQVAGGRQLEAAAQALAAHRHQDGDRACDELQDQRVQFAEHRGARSRQVLLDAGAEAEVRPLGLQKDGAQPCPRQVLAEGRPQRRDHGGVDDVRLGPGKTQAQQGAVLLQFHGEGGRAHRHLPGTRIARRVSLCAWAAAKTSLMSFSGWRSTKGARAIFPSSTRSSASG